MSGYVVDVVCDDQSHAPKVARIVTYSAVTGPDAGTLWVEFDPERPGWTSPTSGRQSVATARALTDEDGVVAEERNVIRCPLCHFTVTRREATDRDVKLGTALDRLADALRSDGHAGRGVVPLSVLAASLRVLDRG